MTPHTTEELAVMAEQLNEIVEPHAQKLRENGIEVLLILCPTDKATELEYVLRSVQERWQQTDDV